MKAVISLDKITKIALVTTNCKKTVAQVKVEQKCQYVMNGSLYNYNTLKPSCKFRADGKTITNDPYGYWMFSWNQGKDIQMIHSNNMEQYLNGIACVALLKDGNKTIINYNKDQGGIRGRSGIGIDFNGNLVMFCSKDGSSLAMTPEKLQVYAKDTLHCKDFIMLDSGTSSSGDFSGETVTSGRKVANYICVWTETDVIKPTGNPHIMSTATLKKGSRGEGVKWLQYQLKSKGYDCGAVDGIFGNGTRSAVMLFQKENGLDDDGIVGKLTREKLVF